MLEIIDKGGIISWGLLFLSVLTISLIVLKFFQLMNLKLANNHFIGKVLEAVSQDNGANASAMLKNSTNPIAQTMAQTLQLAQNGHSISEVKELTQIAGNVALSKLRSLLPWLETIAHIAPMLGLLGTVVGMIKAFQELSTAGVQVDITMLSTGIWEALLTTAIGLVISVIALVFVNVFESKIDRTRDTMSIAISKLFTLLK